MNQNFRKQITQPLAFTERIIRSTSSVLIGVTTLLTKTLIPQPLRETSIYQVTLGMLQRFIVEKVAEVEQEAAENEIDITDDFAQRKLAGTAIEAVGLLTVGFSPLWVFAIISDSVGGSRVYLDRLIDELKEDGLISPESDIQELSDLFNAIQEASSKSALALDMPPLSKKDFDQMQNEVTLGYDSVYQRSTEIRPQLDTLWANMEQLAKRENISMEKLAGIMTLDAMKKGAGFTLAAGRTGAYLFNENILESYRETLRETQQVGFNTYIGEHMRPFIEQAKAHFDANKLTWIETKL
ncbi:MAG: hypothetical protein AAF633_27085 [Chloroflexota bacterium]